MALQQHDIRNFQNYHHQLSWLQIIRPLTLTGTISPIIVGTIMASYKGPIQLELFIVLLIATVFIQAAVNILNDYFDFANGQDKEKWRMTDAQDETQGPSHSQLLFVALGLLVFAAILGLWLAVHTHYAVILIGIIGIYAGYKYSAGGRRSLSALGLGEVIATIFLGFVPMLLALWVQDQAFGRIAFIVACLFAILISMMILTNNIRDIDKDKEFRQTVAMRMGKRRAVQLLTVLSVSAYVLLVVLVISKILPWMTLIVLFAVPFAFHLRMAFRKSATRLEEIKGMKLVAQHHWLFSLLLIVGMLIGGQ